MGAAESFGLQTLAAEWGWDLEIRVWTDSTAAKGVVARVSHGKNMKDVDTKYIWLQQAL